MRSLLLVALAFLRRARGSKRRPFRLTVREVPLHGERHRSAAATPRFDLVGLHWRGAGTVAVPHAITRRPVERLAARADPEAEDLPDVGSAETRAARGWRLGNPTGPGRPIGSPYRLRGRVERLRAYFVRSPEVRVPLRRALDGRLAAADRPRLAGARTRRSAARRRATRRACSSRSSITRPATNSYTARSPPRSCAASRSTT